VTCAVLTFCFHRNGCTVKHGSPLVLISLSSSTVSVNTVEYFLGNISTSFLGSGGQKMMNGGFSQMEDLHFRSHIASKHLERDNTISAFKARVHLLPKRLKFRADGK